MHGQRPILSPRPSLTVTHGNDVRDYAVLWLLKTSSASLATQPQGLDRAWQDCVAHLLSMARKCARLYVCACVRAHSEARPSHMPSTHSAAEPQPLPRSTVT